MRVHDGSRLQFSFFCEPSLGSFRAPSCYLSLLNDPPLHRGVPLLLLDVLVFYASVLLCLYIFYGLIAVNKFELN